jgi:TetR/AcrR family transcriptional regulator
VFATAQPPARRSQQRGVNTRRELLEAALREFAAVGFNAASTRTIAARAGVRQGQLTYHFETKDVLWRATVDHLFERFDAEFSTAWERHGTTGDEDAVTVFESGVRALVRAVSRLPELNRVMVHEATVDSDRLVWLVDRHVRARFEQLSVQWRQVQAHGDTHLDADPVVMYYCLLGAASLLYVNAPEAHHLLGGDDSTPTVTDALVDAHADTIVAMLLGPRPRRTTRTPTRTKGH